MPGSSNFRYAQIDLDLVRSMEFDKEEFLAGFVASMHTTPEEFDRLYILEEMPLKLNMYNDVDRDEWQIETQQQFRIRRKTPEEMTEDFSHSLTQGVN